ncbi:hypothetical protein ES703_56520 [subsurface metagenome]
MSEDPIRKYIDAKRELDSLLSKVEKLQRFMEDVGNALRNPFRFMVSDVNVGFPPEVAMARGIPSLNAKEWPNAQQIAELLASLHKAHHNALTAFMSIPEPDRKNVAPLPDRY